jgi:hypothetical protein
VITLDAGALLLRATIGALELVESLAGCFLDRRHPAQVGLDYKDDADPTSCGVFGEGNAGVRLRAPQRLCPGVTIRCILGRLFAAAISCRSRRRSQSKIGH